MLRDCATSQPAGQLGCIWGQQQLCSSNLLDYLFRSLAGALDVPQHPLDQVKVHASFDAHHQVQHRPENIAPQAGFALLGCTLS